jgi:anti-sigma regulatory factor (Ser/Thr protein kinase)
MTYAELRIPRHPAFVGLARLVVAQAARLAGVPQDRVEDVKIAVDEALANATSAEQLGDRAASLDLRFGTTSGGFEVVVQGLDEPTDAPVPPDHPGLDLLDPKLSFTLIEGLTDEFSYEPDGNRMRLRFVVGIT